MGSLAWLLALALQVGNVGVRLRSKAHGEKNVKKWQLKNYPELLCYFLHVSTDSFSLKHGSNVPGSQNDHRLTCQTPIQGAR